MKNNSSIGISFVCLLLFALSAAAQSNQESYAEKPTEQVEKPFSFIGEKQESVVLDGLYEKISTKEKRVLPYPHIREADVFWQKRVWREIDIRQKMNLPFAYPKQPLVNVLLEIIESQPEASIFLDEDFTTPLTVNDLISRFNSIDTIPIIDPVTFETRNEVVINDFDWTSVSKFRLKEEWVFHKTYSKMMVRILGIAPIRDIYDDNGNYRGQEAMFWAYYPNFREHLVKYEAFNPQNDYSSLTWEDVFEMRYFTSYIMKESNIYDRRISEYATGKDALIESERIKKDLFEFEHNLWTY